MIAAANPYDLSPWEARQVERLVPAFADPEGARMLRELVNGQGCRWRILGATLARVEAQLVATVPERIAPEAA